MLETLTERHPLDALAEEFLERRRAGNQPSIQDYAERHPELAADIRKIFPALLVMEGARREAVASEGELERLGEFRIVGELGRGGMGIVYEAWQESLGRRVALKVLPQHLVADRKRVQRFHREVQAVARLHHSNIVPVYGVSRQGDVHFYVMQLIEGNSLKQLFVDLRWRRQHPSACEPAAGLPGARTPGPALTTELPVSEPAVNPIPWPTSPANSFDLEHRPGTYWRFVARVAAQAAEALDYAHSRGVLHRDIKPANLLVDAGGHAWVLDFGLAKLLPGQTPEPGEPEGEALTASGDLLGTIRYMAPERFTGAGDGRSDVYSLGVTLYELLSLRPAFQATDRVELMHQIVEEEPTELRRLDPRIPNDLATIVSKALEKDPRRRYRSAGELARDLHRFLAGQPIRARQIGPLERFVRWGRRYPLAAGLLGLIVMLITVSYAIIFLEMEKKDRSEAAARRDRDAVREVNRKLEQITKRLQQENYASTIQLADHAWHAPSGLRRCLELLGRVEPTEDAPDRRGFEWHYLRQLCRPERRVLTGHASGVQDIALSPDGARLATMSGDGVVIVWDVARGKPVRSWQAHSGDPAGIKFSPNGQELATAGHEQGGEVYVRLWSPADGTLTSTIAPTNALRVKELAYTASGEQLVLSGSVPQSAPGNARPLAKLIDLKTHAEILAVPDRGLGALAVSPDGQSFTARSPDFTLKVIDSRSGHDLQTFPHSSAVLAAAWSPDGKRLAAGYARGLVIWDVETGKEISRSADQFVELKSVAFSPDGTRVLSASAFDSSLRIHDAATGRELQQLRGHEGPVYGACFLPDGRTLASCSGDRTVALWDLRTASNPQVLEAPRPGSPERLAMNAKGSLVAVNYVHLDRATGLRPRSVQVWDVAQHRMVLSLAEQQMSQIAAGDRLATWTDNGAVTIWNAAEQTEVCRFQETMTPPLTHVLLSSDGTHVVCLGVKGHFQAVVRDAGTGDVVRTVPLGSHFTPQAALSSDGSRLALASGVPVGHPKDVVLTVIDLTTGETLASGRGTKGGHQGVLSLAWSADGQHLVTTHSNEARIWDAWTCAEGLHLRGHTVMVRSAAFSPDGRRLATAGFDQTARLWDLESGHELLTISGNSMFHSLAFDATGTRLATGCGSSVLIWDATPLTP